MEPKLEKMGDILSWTNYYRAYSFLCDNMGKLRLTSMAKFFQESAWEHAENCGAGYHNLTPRGLIWMLHGLRLEIEEYPSWNDELRLETWGKKYENIFAYRDFELFRKESKEPIVKATSSWLMVDIKTHRPQRIAEELKKIPPLDRHALDIKPGNIQVPVDFDSQSQYKTVYSDIDIYNHVNNTSYIGFCLDSPAVLVNKVNGIKIFEIRFMREVKLHEKILISSKRVPEGYYFKAESDSSGTEVFRARALF